MTTLRNIPVKLERPVLDWYVKQAWSQTHSFKNVGAVLQEQFFFFQSLVAILEVEKSRCFQWHFSMVSKSALAADFYCMFFTLGQGEISSCSQRGFCSRVMQFALHVSAARLLQCRSGFPRSLFGFVARFSFWFIHQNLNSVQYLKIQSMH